MQIYRLAFALSALLSVASSLPGQPRSPGGGLAPAPGFSLLADQAPLLNKILADHSQRELSWSLPTQVAGRIELIGLPPGASSVAAELAVAAPGRAYRYVYSGQSPPAVA